MCGLRQGRKQGLRSAYQGTKGGGNHRCASGIHEANVIHRAVTPWPSRKVAFLTAQRRLYRAKRRKEARQRAAMKRYQQALDLYLSPYYGTA